MVVKEEPQLQHPVFHGKPECNIDTKMKCKTKHRRRRNKKNTNVCCGHGAHGDEYRLVSYSELPEYMKENEYILGHYRSDWPLSRALLSLFSWHNETINVWTHLLGFLLFLSLTLLHLDSVPQLSHLFDHLPWSIPPSPVNHTSSIHGNFSAGGGGGGILHQPSSSPGAAARWPLFVFLGGSMFCLLTSSGCHLLCCHTHRLNLFLSRLDYVGIAIMIAASFFPPIYYGFQCSPHWQLAYLAAITAMGVFTVAALLAPHLSTGAFRSYRALLFVGMGLSGVVPAVHAAAANWPEPRRNATLAYEVGMAVAYLTGTGFYVTRVPERWRPGGFDLAGHSHQIFHVFVIAGAMAHYAAALVFLEWRDAVGC